VVVNARGSIDTWTYEKAMSDYWANEDWLNGIKKIQNLGVPFLCAAGNAGQDPNRLTIDTLPAVLQDKDTPIIVVGAADYEGARVPMSQLGSQLRIYAPGKEVLFQTRERGGESQNTGTSVGKKFVYCKMPDVTVLNLLIYALAVPQVAGLIVTYPSYDSEPWDDSKQGVERVKAITDYIASDHSSWERQPGINMIWNDAGEKEHQSAGADGVGTEPHILFTLPTPLSPPPAQPSKALAVILQRELISPASSSAFSDLYRNR
jgi:hypothetical protein